MISIHLYLKNHDHQERLFAAFEYNKTINTIIRNVYGAKCPILEDILRAIIKKVKQNRLNMVSKVVLPAVSIP